MKKITSLTFGLFETSFRYPFTWIKSFVKDTKILFKRIKYLLTHGYGEPALWESFAFFIDQWEEILTFYKEKRNGSAVVIDLSEDITDDWERKNAAAYDKIINRMLKNLKIMKSGDFFYRDDEANEVIKAKNEFFKDFSKYFFDFWD